MASYNVLAMKMVRVRHAHLRNLTLRDQRLLEALLTPPADIKRLNCWLEAFLVLLDSGDIIAAIKKLVTCLTAEVGKQSVAECGIAAIFQLIFGTPIEQVLYEFIRCILGGDGGDDDDDDDDDDTEIDPPNYKEVSRCG